MYQVYHCPAQPAGLHSSATQPALSLSLSLSLSLALPVIGFHRESWVATHTALPALFDPHSTCIVTTQSISIQVFSDKTTHLTLQDDKYINGLAASHSARNTKMCYISCSHINLFSAVLEFRQLRTFK
jgi:hypothetical protein